MTGHPGIAHLATHTGDPLGVDARRVLDDLAAKDGVIAWLMQLAVLQAQRRTVGGLSRTPPAPTNTDPRTGKIIPGWRAP